MTEQSLHEKRNAEKTVEYVISILHKRPEFGEKSEFVSTYYAKEKTSAQKLKKIFAKAFRVAHPSWRIKEVNVSPAQTDVTRFQRITNE